MRIRNALFYTTAVIASSVYGAEAHAGVSSTFTKGAVARYSGSAVGVNANGTDSAQLFSELNITSVTISQTGAFTTWSQGNDTAVSVTVKRSGGLPDLTFSATMNWVSTGCNGNGCDYIGLVFSDTVDDGFAASLPAGSYKTYILQFDQSTVNLATLAPNNIDGAANFGAGAFAALDAFGGDGVAPTVTASQSFNYAENQVAGAVVGTVAATDNTAVTAFRFSATGTSTSADGYYTIDNTGKISITAAGVAAGVANNDFEINPNQFTYGIQAGDAAGNWSTATNITLNVTDVDDTPPVLTGPSNGAGAAASSITVNENQTGVTQMTASENVTWAIVGGNDQGKFQIAPDGTITFVAAPDFEAPTDSDTNNSYVLTVEATDAQGNKVTQQVTVNVANLDDTAPLITGPTNGAGAAASAITVDENQTAVTKLVADENVTWAIVSGNDQGKFQIAPDGTITFVAAPDFEAPTDSDTNNTYVLVVEATDAAGNKIQQTVTVTVANVDDAAPIITGPSGGAGAAASTITVNENQTGVTRVTANEAVTWSITGGNDQGKFQIAADGTITFVAAPDFEAPTDSDTNNSYILTITATDAAGNRSVQTITVNVANIDDTAPLITGPSGGAGAAASALTINEGLTAVTTFTANETVTWSIDGGSDAAKFQINAQTGAITFLSAPDFEAPTDSDRNNTYVVRVKAVDAAGNISYQTLTVTIVNVDEIARKLSEIGGKLRSGLRQYAAKGLSDMLSFNEGLMQNGDDDVCAAPGNQKALSGALNASEAGGTAKLDYSKQLTDCSRNYRIFFDVGLTYSKFGDGWNARQYASTRFEAKLDEDFVLGVGLLASKSNDQIAGFDDSSISDGSVQMNLYGRYKFTPELRTGAFFGLGRAWYDFGLTEADGFVLDGKMTGKRSIYGWMLSGDINVGDMVVTTDAVVSHATEKLGNAKLAAQYRGESRSGIDFEVGTVNVTRISIPASAPIKLSGDENGIGGWSKLVISPGLLCEDNGVTSNSLTCGYQIGAKFVSQQSVRDRFYGDFQWESVSGMRRSMFAVGYAYRFGKDNKMELGLELQNGNSGLAARDSKALLSVRLAR